MNYRFSAEGRQALIDYKLTIGRRERLAAHLLEGRVLEAARILGCDREAIIDHGRSLCGFGRSARIARRIHERRPELPPADFLILTILPHSVRRELLVWFLLRHAERHNRCEDWWMLHHAEEIARATADDIVATNREMEREIRQLQRDMARLKEEYRRELLEETRQHEREARKQSEPIGEEERA